jgi:ABC-type sugar transport system substrate-binding protein
MENLRIAIVAVENNDFQALQVAAAREAAARLGVDLRVVEIEHDAVLQSQEILKLLQSPADSRPHGVMFEPVGTPLAQPARLAASSGIGWVVLNRAGVDYIPELRTKYSSPAFTVTASHVDVGRVQAQQMAQLLPHGGLVLYIQGPSSNDASIQRTTGMQGVKPANIEVRYLKGAWTETSGYEAISSFLRLTTSREAAIRMVVAQNDAMALGARRAFQELTSGADQAQYLRLPFLGCDGLPNFGQAAVHHGNLAATVVIPPTAGQAVEALASALRTRQQPPELIVTQATSFPPLTSLKPVAL